MHDRRPLGDTTQEMLRHIGGYGVTRCGSRAWMRKAGSFPSVNAGLSQQAPCLPSVFAQHPGPPTRRGTRRVHTRSRWRQRAAAVSRRPGTVPADPSCPPTSNAWGTRWRIDAATRPVRPGSADTLTHNTLIAKLISANTTCRPYDSQTSRINPATHSRRFGGVPPGRDQHHEIGHAAARLVARRRQLPEWLRRVQPGSVERQLGV